MAAPEIIQQLVKRFEEHRDSYRSGKYNETQLRREFLDPFLKALGWDIDNEQGYAEAYKDVIHEDSLEVEGATKAPDYAFRIGGTRKFYVEAKKPSVNIQYDIHPAFQLRRYAWSAKLPVSILTDFEEFAVYESRSKPDKSDSAATGRVLLLNYKDYLTKWDEIAAIFSREAVLKGSFDQYAEGLKGKRGTTEVDDAFLQEIEHWRDLLARMIALRNPSIRNEREMNYAVQMTIDRIVFLRICEDRGIERENQLQELLEGEGVYERLCQVFRQADSRYNSGLFHFSEEKGQSSTPDDLTLRLVIDDKVLKEIISGLYYPAPYVFREIPADILGQVYERFLGKVIRLTAGHQAKVEEKPEVRKAGGVYYTPTYIVDYIVKNTVGKLLEGKTAKEATSIKILDPACGSGSFLLGAYQYLLDWHTTWYSGHEPETWAKGRAPAIYQAQGGDYRLTTAEKKRILLGNIHGVDIDPQAVEVTKLSLSLKVLEGESQESIGAQLGLFKERALPDLGKNIKWGNSLIHPGEYTRKQLTFLETEDGFRIVPFDWYSGFPEIMRIGGFDVIIGNPPYVRPHNIPEDIKDMLWAIYSTFVAKSDMYSCFMERGLTLTKPGGLFSFIVPHTWTSLESFTEIRIFIICNARVKKLVQLPKKVFTDATVETCIFVIEKSAMKPDQENIISVEKLNTDSTLTSIRQFSQREIESAYLYNFQLYGQTESLSIISRIQEKGKSLSDFVTFAYGFKTADDEQFIHTEKNNEECYPFIRSAGAHRYWTDQPKEYVWYVPEKMIRNRKTARPGEKARFEAEKIIVSRMGKSLVATYDLGGLYVKDAMLLLAKEDKPSLKYLLGVINSHLLTYYYQKFFITIDVLKNALLSLPIVNINFSDPAEKASHDKIVSLVERMLALHKRSARTPQEKEMIQREIESTDGEIDALVYHLYGLTEEEIKIVEGG